MHCLQRLSGPLRACLLTTSILEKVSSTTELSTSSALPNDVQLFQIQEQHVLFTT